MTPPPPHSSVLNREREKDEILKTDAFLLLLDNMRSPRVCAKYNSIRMGHCDLLKRIKAEEECQHLFMYLFKLNMMHISSGLKSLHFI